MRIRTNNLNGFNHVLTGRDFNTRAILTFALYKDSVPSVWALQEVPTGGRSQVCIKQLQGLALKHGYTMVMPEKTNWKLSDHPKSIQSVLLLKDAKNVEVLKLDDRIELFNRYNYVKAVLDCVEYFILNIHVPQTEFFPGHKENDGYIRLRKHLAKQFFEVLKEEVSRLVTSGKRVILLGDFNKNVDQPEIKELIALGLCDIASVKDNTYFCTGNNKEDSVDHILVSQNIADEIKNSAKCSVDTDFVKVQKLSDHATVELDIAI